MSPFGACASLVGCALLALLSTGCFDRMVAEREEVPRAVLPETAYEELFPHYVELCAVSQFRALDGGTGGSPGHAVMYLKGACLDADAPYPRLRQCAPGATNAEDPEHGAGVSVNRWFRNVNWVATPGRRLFFDGDLESGERLTEARAGATVKRAIAAGIFEGVELHAYPTSAEERSLEDFVVRQSLATDFALRFARSVFCARLPVTAEMMDEIVDFLNDLNREYATSAAEYAWSGYHDNCVHTLRNALAAASVWEPKSVNAIKLRQFFHLAIPANEAVDLARLGTAGPLADFGEIYASDASRHSLLEFGWLPNRHGALITVLPAHRDNDLYDTRMRIFVLQNPLRLGVTRDAEELGQRPSLRLAAPQPAPLPRPLCSDPRRARPAGIGLRHPARRSVPLRAATLLRLSRGTARGGGRAAGAPGGGRELPRAGAARAEARVSRLGEANASSPCYTGVANSEDRMNTSYITGIVGVALCVAVSASAAELYIYPQKGQSAQQQEKDKFECYGWAKGQSGFDPMAPPTTRTAPPKREGGSVAGGAAGGAVGGAAVGAVAGAIRGKGGVGKSAAIGAGTGGLIGGMGAAGRNAKDEKNLRDWEQQEANAYAQRRREYNRAYAACLEGRGYTVK